MLSGFIHRLRQKDSVVLDCANHGAPEQHPSATTIVKQPLEVLVHPPLHIPSNQSEKSTERRTYKELPPLGAEPRKVAPGDHQSSDRNAGPRPPGSERPGYNGAPFDALRHKKPGLIPMPSFDLFERDRTAKVSHMQLLRERKRHLALFDDSKLISLARGTSIKSDRGPQ